MFIIAKMKNWIIHSFNGDGAIIDICCSTNPRHIILSVAEEIQACRMASCGMLLRVALVRKDVSEELSASFIRVKRISELGTLAITSNRRTLRRNCI
jgi:hypothetical protein